MLMWFYRPNFYFTSLLLNEKETLTIVRIMNNQTEPPLANNDYSGLKQGTVAILHVGWRRNSSA